MSKKTTETLVPKLRFPEFRDAGEWHEKPLGKICDFLNNRRKPITSNNREKGIYPYYGASGIVDYVKDYIFEERLLLVGEDGAKWGAFERTAFIVEGKYWVNNHAHVLRSTEINDTLLENYLVKLDLGPYITGAAPPKLTLGKLKDVPVPFPSEPEEQQKIADCLSSVDELISTQAQKVDALKAHKKGLMQQLFPAEGETVPKLRFPEFRDKGEWVPFKLKNEILKKVIDNRGKTPPLSDTGYPLVEVNALGARSIEYTQIKKYVDEVTYKNWFRAHVREGDILFSTVGAIAETSLVCNTDNPVIAQNIVGLRVKENFLPEFVLYLFSETHNKNKFLQITMGAVQPSLKVSQMVGLSFLVPEREEQQKIADCLSAIDDLITTQAKKIDALKIHKKGLMQQLFPTVGEVNG